MDHSLDVLHFHSWQTHSRVAREHWRRVLVFGSRKWNVDQNPTSMWRNLRASNGSRLGANELQKLSVLRVKSNTYLNSYAYETLAKTFVDLSSIGNRKCCRWHGVHRTRNHRQTIFFKSRIPQNQRYLDFPNQKWPVLNVLIHPSIYILPVNVKKNQIKSL